MTIKFEKILNPWVLLALNILILLATELSGHFFQDKGIIHLIAILFVIFGISRIFVHYDAYDRYLRPLIKGGLAALIIFSASHLVEFLGFVAFKTYEDAIFVNVVNFYVMSMLGVAIGAEYFLRALQKSRGIKIWISVTSIAVLLLLTVLIFMNKISVSLEPDEPLVFIYGAMVLVASIFSLNRLATVKRHVSVMVDFVNFFIAAFILITISAFQYVFYDVLQGWGMPDFQIVYVSHFLFYGALSLMFLAFVRLTNLGGIYADAEKYKNKSTDET